MTMTRGSIVFTLLLTCAAHPAVCDDAPRLSELGLAQVGRGELAQAQATLERCLAIDDVADDAQPRPDRRLRRVYTLNVLAALRSARGEGESAERLLRRAMALGAGLPPEADAEVAETLTGLARMVAERGDTREAVDLASQALKHYQRVVGPRRVERVEALVMLASLAAARGRTDEAEALLRSARRVAELEDAPPAVRSIVLIHFGMLRMAQGRYPEAESLLEDALESAAQAMGADHPGLLPSMEVLAECYRRRGRIDDAMALYERALRVAQRVYGADSPAAAPIVAGLAALKDDAAADRRDAFAARGHGGSAK
jgi:tetratricopeptide (TPR) repeat protein